MSIEVVLEPEAGLRVTGAVLAHASSVSVVSREDIGRLPRTGWMPVGSVAFVFAALDHQGVARPTPLDYPDALAPFAASPHRLGRYGDLPPGWSPERPGGIHAKPLETKLDPTRWTASTPFWIGPWRSFRAEFRVYVLRHQIAGCARYDGGEDTDEETLAPDLEVVRAMIERYRHAGAPAGYALDVGIPEGEDCTRLVEVNDGWALGLYAGCDPRAYLDLLEARWLEIVTTRAR